MMPKLPIVVLTGSMKLVSGALLEGSLELDGKPEDEWIDKVTHYSVDFSPDGRLWSAVVDENGYYRVIDTFKGTLLLSQGFSARGGLGGN